MSSLIKRRRMSISNASLPRPILCALPGVSYSRRYVPGTRTAHKPRFFLSSFVCVFLALQPHRAHSVVWLQIVRRKLYSVSYSHRYSENYSGRYSDIYSERCSESYSERHSEINRESYSQSYSDDTTVNSKLHKDLQEALQKALQRTLQETPQKQLQRELQRNNYSVHCTQHYTLHHSEHCSMHYRMSERRTTHSTTGNTTENFELPLQHALHTDYTQVATCPTETAPIALQTSLQISCHLLYRDTAATLQKHAHLHYRYWPLALQDSLQTPCRSLYSDTTVITTANQPRRLQLLYRNNYRPNTTD